MKIKGKVKCQESFLKGVIFASNVIKKPLYDMSVDTLNIALASIEAGDIEFEVNSIEELAANK